MRIAKKSARILVVDDDVAVRSLLARLLAKKSWEAVIESSGKDALDRFAAESFDAAIIDVDIGDGYDGLAVAQTLRYLSPKLKIVMMSGNIEHAERVRDAGFGELLVKPFETKSLMARLRP